FLQQGQHCSPEWGLMALGAPATRLCLATATSGAQLQPGTAMRPFGLSPRPGPSQNSQLQPADASASAWLQMEDLGLATVTYPTENQDPVPTFSSQFHHQVGGFFILANFQRFLETAYRALRHLASL
uniref:MGF factor n=1 Tax=Zonotrichia albicollis TaxID=44394 RepID=A0A8D2MRJ2_ZONAL